MINDAAFRCYIGRYNCRATIGDMSAGQCGKLVLALILEGTKLVEHLPGM
jgi:hypothetical protein